MSDPIIDQPIDTFVVYTGAPKSTVLLVNQALKDYAVVQWNWAVCDGVLVLSALMCSLTEIRRAQLAVATIARQPHFG